MRSLWLKALAVALGILTNQAAPIGDLAFSPDGARLASPGHQRVDLRSTETAETIDSIACEFPRVTALTFTGKDALVVGGGTPGESGKAVWFDGRAKKARREFGGFGDLVMCAAVNPKGTWLALGGADHRAVLESLDPGKPQSIELSGHTGPVLGAAFSPDGEWLVTASADRSLKVWKSDGTLARSFNNHTERVNDVVFRPREEGLAECASASDDGTVRIWQPGIGRMVRIIRGHAGAVFAVAYSPDGTALFSSGREGVIRRLDVGSDAILARTEAGPEPIYSLAVSPDGRRLASGDWAGRVKLWDISGQEIRSIGGPR